MFHLEDVLQLKDTEAVKLVIRRHPLTLFPGFLVAVFFIVAPFFFLFPLFGWGWPGVVIFFVLVGVGVFIAARTVLTWDADVLVVSNQRLVDVDQRGMLSRFVSDIPMASIQDVSWSRKGLWQTLLRIGSISITTNGTLPNIGVTHVSHPQEIQELINDLRRATVPVKEGIAPDHRDRLRRLMDKIEKLSPEALAGIETAVQNAGRSEAVDSFLHTDEKASS